MAKPIQAGAGWLKTGKNGEYISISFKTQELQGIDLGNCWCSLTPNSRKSKDTHPDYNLVVTPKEENRQTQAPQQTTQARSAFPRPGSTTERLQHNSASPPSFNDCEDPEF